jgi:hypothetical protein
MKAAPKGGLRANDDAFQIVGFQGIGISRYPIPLFSM